MLEGATIGAAAGGVSRVGAEIQSSYLGGGGEAFSGNTSIASVTGGIAAGAAVAPIIYVQGYHNGYNKGKGK